MIQPSDVKQCIACQEYKLRTEFHKNMANRDGKQAKCKDCVSSYNAQRRARLVAQDPDWETKFRAANQAYQAIWRRNNPERSRQYSRAWYARNRERLALRNRAARQALAAAEAAAARESHEA